MSVCMLKGNLSAIFWGKKRDKGILYYLIMKASKTSGSSTRFQQKYYSSSLLQESGSVGRVTFSNIITKVFACHYSKTHTVPSK